MYPWRTRLAHVHVPGEPPQWCIDNGEDDLIACGPEENGKERARKLADTLNLGLAANAKGATLKPLMDAAKALYEKCQALDLLTQRTFPPGMRNQQIDELCLKIGEIQTEATNLQRTLLA
ncbi:MAG: hypothetical protein ACLQME_21185 [Alphaproteobacteria bacterium]